MMGCAPSRLKRGLHELWMKTKTTLSYILFMVSESWSVLAPLSCPTVNAFAGSRLITLSSHPPELASAQTVSQCKWVNEICRTDVIKTFISMPIIAFSSSDQSHNDEATYDDIGRVVITKGKSSNLLSHFLSILLRPCSLNDTIKLYFNMRERERDKEITLRSFHWWYNVKFEWRDKEYKGSYTWSIPTWS